MVHGDGAIQDRQQRDGDLAAATVRSAVPIVLVDMDGVLADFDCYVINRLLPECPELLGAEKRDSFYLLEAFPSYAHRIREFTSHRGFFASLPVVEGSQEGWARIRRAGFAPRVCSRPLSRNPFSSEEKRSWLARHFGRDASEQAIITDEKFRCGGIAMIDDAPTIPGSSRAQWQHVIFDRPYNRNVTDAPRLRGWDDPELEMILREAHDRYIQRLD